MNKTSSLVLILLPAMFVASAPASAAVVEHAASTGVDGEDVLVYTAGKGEPNRLKVTASKTTLTFSDPSARITPKRGDLGACKGAERPSVAAAHRSRPACSARARGRAGRRRW